MTDTKTHTLNLTNGAVTLLKTTLAMAGWYENQKVSVTIRAADLLEKPEVTDLKAPILPKAETADVARANADIEDTWARGTFQLTVTEGEREAAKVCIRHFLKKAALAPSTHVRALVNELGLADE